MGARWGCLLLSGCPGDGWGWCHCWGSGIRVTGDRGQAVTSPSWAGAQRHRPLLQGVQGVIRAGEVSECSTSHGESWSCPPA